MKKTLIALAVLAASGASFAQATITGNLGFGFQQSFDGVKGLAATDGNLKVSANEDLGGGMKVMAASSFDLRGRGNSFVPTDATLTLVTGAGAFTIGSIESGNGIVNKSGAPISLISGFDNGTLLDAASNVDVFSYAVPIGPVALAVTYTDGGSALTAAGASAQADTATGPGAGFAQSLGAKMTYTAGPLMAALGYTTYRSSGQSVGTNALGLNGQQAADGATRTQLTGSYDFGVAKLGAGYQMRTQTSGVDNLVGSAGAQTTIDVSVPMGAATFGLAWANRAANGNTGAGVASTLRQVSGWEIGMNYALSKQTSFNVALGNQKVDGSDAQTEYRTKMVKSF